VNEIHDEAAKDASQHVEHPSRDDTDRVVALGHEDGLPLHQELPAMRRGHKSCMHKRSEKAHLFPPGEKLVRHGGVSSQVPDLRNSRIKSALSRT
jgi:hypothetical protein